MEGPTLDFRVLSSIDHMSSLSGSDNRGGIYVINKNNPFVLIDLL